MKIQTVLGDVPPEMLGRTLTHEHFALDFRHFYREPPIQLKDEFTQPPITLQTLGALRQYPHCSNYNLNFNDADSNLAVLNDVIAYKKYGGGAIVENTTMGLGRNLKLMKDISTTSGVHVLAGTGFYIADMQDTQVHNWTKENMYDHMLHELVTGCKDDATIKAGFMGEIASVWPIKDLERKAIVAAGELQEQLGCGVSFHPHRVPEAPFQIMRLYAEAGGKLDKAVMSHLDRTIFDEETLLEFANLGCYCQFDLFGVEVSYYQLNEDTDMLSDAQRLKKILLLIKEGKSDRILISHDIHTKHRLTDFGGHGFSHILNNVLPRLRRKGISEEVIDTITITSPTNWLSMPIN